VWVYLDPGWVQDGAVPELGRGSVLSDTGLRASCRSLAAARTDDDGLTMLSGPKGLDGCWYQLTGRAGPARDTRSEVAHLGAEFLITVGDREFVAHAGVPAGEVTADLRVTAACTLSVIADYEWDAFDLPGRRTSWWVRQLRMEYRRYRGPGAPWSGPPGVVLASASIDRMHRWPDAAARSPGLITWYILDLIPLPDRGSVRRPGSRVAPISGGSR
jgi:hypothetical protein